MATSLVRRMTVGLYTRQPSRAFPTKWLRQVPSAGSQATAGLESQAGNRVYCSLKLNLRRKGNKQSVLAVHVASGQNVRSDEFSLTTMSSKTSDLLMKSSLST